MKLLGDWNWYLPKHLQWPRRRGSSTRPQSILPGPSRNLAATRRARFRGLSAVLATTGGDGASGFATPATNRQIAAEAHLSVDAVEAHLRLLFDRTGLGGLPQNERRARLAARVLADGP
jgi:hypothetical protein